MKNKNKQFSLIVSVYLIFILVFITNLDSKLKPVDLTNYLRINYRYLLTPAKQSLYTTAGIHEYPYVQTPVWSIKYPLIQINEKIEIYNGKYDELFFASKRIAEIIKWSNQLEVLGRYPDLHSLKKYYLRNPFVFSNWENILARYHAHLENTLRDSSRGPEREQRLLSLHSYIEKNENVLYQVVFSSGFSTSKKKYLRKLIHSLNNHLKNQIPRSITYPNPRLIDYSLEEIMINRDYGYYDISFKSLDKIEVGEKDFQLSVGRKNYDVSKIPDTNEYIIDNVYLGPNSQNLKLSVRRDLNVSKDIPWSTADPNMFTLSLNPEKLTDTILVKIRYRSVKPINISIKQAYWEKKQLFTDKLSNRFSRWLDRLLSLFRVSPIDNNLKEDSIPEEIISTTILDDFLDPSGESKEITRAIKPKNDRVITQFQVQMYSKDSLLDSDLEKVKMSLSPIFLPSLTLIKTKPMDDIVPKVTYKRIRPNHYQLHFSSLSLDQENYILKNLGYFWQTVDQKETKSGLIVEVTNILPRLSARVLLVITVLLMLIRNIWPQISKLWLQHRQETNRMLMKIYVWFFHHIEKFSNKHRKLLLITTIIMVTINILVIPIRSTGIICLIFLLIWTTLKGFKQKGLILINTSLILMLLCLLLSSLQLYLLAENVAAWIFLLLLMGVILISLEK